MLVAESQIFDARGHATIRGGVVNSLVAGTVRVLQGHDPDDITNFAVTFTAATVVDTISGFNVLDFSVPVFRRYIVVRFVGDADFVPGNADTWEFSAFVLPISVSP